MTVGSAAAPGLADVLVTHPGMRPGDGDAGPGGDDVECFALHRVHWCSTGTTADGRDIVWHFRAPDAESVRIALRCAGIAFEAVTVVRRGGVAGATDEACRTSR